MIIISQSNYAEEKGAKDVGRGWRGLGSAGGGGGVYSYAHRDDRLADR